MANLATQLANRPRDVRTALWIPWGVLLISTPLDLYLTPIGVCGPIVGARWRFYAAVSLAIIFLLPLFYATKRLISGVRKGNWAVRVLAAVSLAASLAGLAINGFFILANLYGGPAH